MILMTINVKSYLLLALIILILSLLGKLVWNKKFEMTPPVVNQISGEIGVTGKIDCLPHKGNGPSTMECAFGLKANNGRYYGLTGLNQEKLMSGEIDTGVNVKVSGILTTDPKSNYDIVGVIEIKNVEVLQ